MTAINAPLPTGSPPSRLRPVSPTNRGSQAGSGRHECHPVAPLAARQAPACRSFATSRSLPTANGRLVGPEGDIAWMCAPRWHDDAVFSDAHRRWRALRLRRANCYTWGGEYERDADLAKPMVTARPSSRAARRWRCRRDPHTARPPAPHPRLGVAAPAGVSLSARRRSAAARMRAV